MLGHWTLFFDKGEMTLRITSLVPHPGPLSRLRDRRPISGTAVLPPGRLSHLRDRCPTSGTAVPPPGPLSYLRDGCPKRGTRHVSKRICSDKCFTVGHNLHNPHGTLEILQSIISYMVGEQHDG